MNKFILLIISSLILLSCSTSVNNNDKWPPACYPKKQLPYGNINRDSTVINSKNQNIQNTKEDELAPTQRPNLNDNDYSNCKKVEFQSNIQEPIDGIKASSKFLNYDLNLANELNRKAIQFLTDDIESITFIDPTHGFVSFSHPPSPEFATKMMLPISEIVGGTDIFFFEQSSSDFGRYVFKNLSGFSEKSEINSEFWDSHPFAFKTEKDGTEIIVLLWSSDRQSPYSKIVDLNHQILNNKNHNSSVRGQTDIYYSLRINGIWTKAQKINSEEINSPNSSEGTPFIYCKCKNPLLLFSTNRRDKTPMIIEKQREEDFDIDSARLVIDFDRAIQLKGNDFYNPRKINNLIKQVSSVGTFPKQKETILVNKLDKPDSTINTFSDDRFPFVPYPISQENLSIYLSSNRNKEPFNIQGNKYIQNEGKYDIYHFPFNVECKEPPPEPPCEYNLIVRFYDITNKTDEINTKTTIELYDNNNNLLETQDKNPAVFKIKKLSKYYVKGKVVPQKQNKKECNDIIDFYWKPLPDTITESLEFTEIDTVNRLININNLNDFLGEGKKTEKNNQIYYHNSLKYNADFIIVEKYIKQRPHPTNSNLIYVDLARTTFIKTKPQLTYINRFNNFIDSLNFLSMKTHNGGIYTFDYNEKCPTIDDTIFVAMHYDTVKCIDLQVTILDKLNPNNEVKKPLYAVFEVDSNNNKIKEIEPYELKADKAKYHLIYGSKYTVFGGSNFKENNLCKDEVLEYYCNCQEQRDNKYIKCEPLTTASVKSNKTLRNILINTNDYPSGTQIEDTVLLCPKYYKPLPCIYSFNEFKKDLDKIVPYFQTAYWIVNTEKNLKTFLKDIRNKKSILRQPFKLNTPPSAEITNWNAWYDGAKWIDLHPSNSYYFNSINRASFDDKSQYLEQARKLREQRIWCYRNYAKKVSKNLKIIGDMICDTLVPAFNYISKTSPDCQFCSDKKLIIRIEAWSDKRPVNYGWYITDDPNKKFIKYAECDDINNYKSSDPLSTFKPVKIHEFDTLGKNNTVLSQLRAYYGFLEIYNNYLKGKLRKDDGTLYSDDEILLPDEMVDENGNLLPNEKLNELFEKSKIIVVIKGYSIVAPARESSPSKYIRCGNRWDGIRSLEVKVKPMQYYNGKMLSDSCCDPKNIIIRKEKNKYLKQSFTKSEKLNNKFIISFGKYNDHSVADAVYNNLNKLNLKNLKLEKENINGDVFYKVYIGPFKNYYKAEKYLKKIKKGVLRNKEIDCSIFLY